MEKILFITGFGISKDFWEAFFVDFVRFYLKGNFSCALWRVSKMELGIVS